MPTPNDAVTRDHAAYLPTVLWRCKDCGKYSAAQRRPRRHMRTVVIERPSQCSPLCDNCAPWGVCGGASPGVFERRWCGPFERLLAFVDDPEPPHPHPSLGEPVPDDADFLYVGEAASVSEEAPF